MSMTLVCNKLLLNPLKFHFLGGGGGHCNHFSLGPENNKELKYFWLFTTQTKSVLQEGLYLFLNWAGWCQQLLPPTQKHLLSKPSIVFWITFGSNFQMTDRGRQGTGARTQTWTLLVCYSVVRIEHMTTSKSPAITSQMPCPKLSEYLNLDQLNKLDKKVFLEYLCAVGSGSGEEACISGGCAIYGWSMNCLNWTLHLTTCYIHFVSEFTHGFR